FAALQRRSWRSSSTKAASATRTRCCAMGSRARQYLWPTPCAAAVTRACRFTTWHRRCQGHWCSCTPR
ncbi:hypothetical protein H4R35_006954, partial [Dimargaris xerosporica]